MRNSSFLNLSIKAENPIVLKLSANDYCSCSSVGDFDIQRAEELRTRGNNTLDAYVTYDVARLTKAMCSILTERTDFAGHKIIGRRIEYGQKDRSWQIEEEFEHKELRTQLAIYLSIVFIKSPAYAHEDEYRMIIIDPAALGKLDASNEWLQFSDPRIADAIVASVTF